MLGWRIEGDVATSIKKYVMIAAPHTSWWDFPLGLLVRSAKKLQIKYLGKHTLFKPPFGFFFRWTGGIPIDRRSRNHTVDSLINAFERHDRMAIVMAPEGTRKKVDKFKSGFYHIARGLGVPVVMVTFDFGRRVVTFSPPMELSENKEEDLNTIWNHFKGVRGKVPEKGIF
jgi:1-acyl-sn-glycerol-3-phosphate acyltransferase